MSAEAAKALREAEDKIFDENQAKLPEDDRIGMPFCKGVSPDGFSCTKREDHDGQHAAHGALGTILKKWD